MIRASTINRLEFFFENIKRIPYLRYFFFGMLLPLGFAPFHFPGMLILGLALFYNGLNKEIIEGQRTSAFLSGLVFGLGFFGLGISWIYISIHEYGHLYSLVAALITLFFLLYLSLFTAIIAYLYSRLVIKPNTLYSGLLFSALWIGGEFLRSSFLSGFPWLLIGFGQFDTPTKFILPILGVFGAGFLTCFSSTVLSLITRIKGPKRFTYVILFVGLLLSPCIFSKIKWAEVSKEGVSVGIIQANLSMRDKWDETLFWQLLQHYQQQAESLLGTHLIVLPESAIPLPATYLSDYLGNLKQQAKLAGSAILLGIPQPTTIDENNYYNALISLGKAKGSYYKQHLVPFGEYIPRFFQLASNWLGIPEANLKAGISNQPLVKVHRHPIASLICYELAYGQLLRNQLPEAEWIVSISDDGWFGHSLAMYQQQQMAQVRSLQSARFQVVSNNDGLSSLINTEGNIIASLPANTAGIVKATLFPASGITPWVRFGDLPILIFSLLIIMIYTAYRFFLLKVFNKPIAAKHKRRYPYQPH